MNKKKYLITGITGFLAPHLAEIIFKEGHEVYGLSRRASGMESDILDCVTPKCYEAINFLYGDLEDYQSLEKIFKENKFDGCYHCAAQSNPPISLKFPIMTWKTNVMGSMNLIDVIEKYNPECKLCFVSTSEVYGNSGHNGQLLKEDDKLAPSNPYGASKSAIDLYLQERFTNKKINGFITRAFSHSVGRDTPIIVRENGNLIDIVYISSIRKLRKKGKKYQEWDLRNEKIEVWNDGYWTKINKVSCHPINKCKMLEINSRMGIVDVTDNHSIIMENSTVCEAGSLKISDKIKITKMPSIEITEVDNDICWLYGLFVAEGWCKYEKGIRSSWKIYNNKKELLERAKNILLKKFSIESTISISASGKNKNTTFSLQANKGMELTQKFRYECYADDENKKIPKIILNASKECKKSFLSGFNLGDGRTTNTHVRSEFVAFTTKSPILALGLCYLIESALDVKYRIRREHRKQGQYGKKSNDFSRYFQINIISQTNLVNGFSDKKNDKIHHWIKSDNEIVKITELPYVGEVWDLETENNWFHAGMGGNIVHNTGERRGKNFSISSDAYQIARIIKGMQDPILEVGNLETTRVVIDGKDVAMAYYELMMNEKSNGHVYNVCGTMPMKMQYFTDKLIEIAELMVPGLKIEKKVSEKYYRPIDIEYQAGDTTKLKNLTGWEPKIPIEKTLGDLLNYWLKKLS